MSGTVEGVTVTYSGDATSAAKAGEEVKKSVAGVAEAVEKASKKTTTAATQTSAIFGTEVSKGAKQAAEEFSKFTGTINAAGNALGGLPPAIQKVGSVLQTGIGAFAVGGALSLGITALVTGIGWAIEKWDLFGTAAAAAGQKALDGVKAAREETLKLYAALNAAAGVGKQAEAEDLRRSIAAKQAAVKAAIPKGAEAQFAAYASSASFHDTSQKAVPAYESARNAQLDLEDTQDKLSLLENMIEGDLIKPQEDALKAEIKAREDAAKKVGQIEHDANAAREADALIAAIDVDRSLGSDTTDPALTPEAMRKFNDSFRSDRVIDYTDALMGVITAHEEANVAAGGLADKLKSVRAAAESFGMSVFEMFKGVAHGGKIDVGALASGAGGAIGTAFGGPIGGEAGSMAGGMVSELATKIGDAVTGGIREMLAGSAGGTKLLSGFEGAGSAAGMAVGAASLMGLALGPLAGALGGVLVPLVAFGAFIAILSTKTQEYADITAVVGAAIDALIEPLGALWEPIEPLVGLFVVLAKAIAPMIGALIHALVGASGIETAVSVLIGAIMIASAWMAFYAGVLGFVGDLFAEMGSTMMSWVMTLPYVSQVFEMLGGAGAALSGAWFDAASSMLAVVRSLALAMAGFIDTLEAAFGVDIAGDGALRKAARKAQKGINQINDARDFDPQKAYNDALKDLTDGIKEGAGATKDNTDALNGFNRDIQNLPTGVKLAAMEFTAAEGEARPTFNIGTWVSRGDVRTDVEALKRISRNGTVAAWRGRVATSPKN